MEVETMRTQGAFKEMEDASKSYQRQFRRIALAVIVIGGGFSLAVIIVAAHFIAKVW